MNISVRVAAANAQRQIAQLQGQVTRLETQLKSTNRTSSNFGGGGMASMTKWGSQMQWMGRQLIYNFTLPIAAAGVAATKFALNNEAAMVRVTKVYGDATHNAQNMRGEVNALSRAFVALSNEFGVNQAEVIGIAADWAQAGASGVALARATKLTLQTMVLGEMSATEATQALISIQAQYGQSTTELAKTIAILNMVENQTGITMQGLIQGFTRSAGVARAAGIDVRHLAAMLAALTPAAGSATTAGNGLRTIISRLIAPTKDATGLMAKMGIDVTKSSWQMQNGTQRIETMATAFHGLSDAQKNLVSKTLASQFQINRFNVVMQDVYNGTHKAAGGVSYYGKALQSTQTDLQVFNQMQNELRQVMTSDPQQLKRTWVILQNAMSKAIIPLLPVIQYFASLIASLATKFSNLNPSVQKLAIIGLLLLAVVGPIVRYMGAWAVLTGEVTKAFGWLSRAIGITRTEIELENGAIAMQRVGLIGLIRTMLLMPFALMASGWKLATEGVINFVGISLRGIGGLIGRMRVMAVLGPLIGGIWRAAAVSMMASLTVFRSMMGILIALFRAGGIGAGTALTEGFRRSFALLFTLGRTTFTALSSTIFILLQRIPMAFMTVVRSIGPWLLRGLLSPWTLAIAAILGLVYAFRGQIGTVIRNIQQWWAGGADGIVRLWAPLGKFFGELGSGIQKVFWMLPNSIQSAMLAVFRIVKAAALDIYKAMQYINPFARHSPSLVESSHKGMRTVSAHHEQAARKTSDVYSRASNDLSSFKSQTQNLTGIGAQYKDERATVAKVDPAALASFDRLIADLKILYPLMNQAKNAMDKQQAVVDKWKVSLDQANSALEVQQKKLDGLQATQKKYQDQVDAAKQAMQDWASTPIQGMKVFTDAIFDNQQAQNKLQLQMMKWEDANGTLDDLQKRLADINGNLEEARGHVRDLQNQGAGSDVTGPYQDQVAALEAAQKSATDSLRDSPIAAMQKQFDALQRSGQELNLEQSIKFDPLTKQIQDMTSAMKEVPFDQIVAGIRAQQAALDAAQPKLDAANAAVDKQQAVVDAATAARDKLQTRYDIEDKKLQTLTDRYNQVHDSIQNIEDALNAVSSAADKAAGSMKQSASATQFDQAAGANFPNVAGTGQIGREGSWADQSKQIDDMVNQLNTETTGLFGKFDLLSPIKKTWKKATDWLSTNVGPTLGPIGSGISDVFSNIKIDLAPGFKKSVAGVTTAISWVWDKAKDLFKLFAPDLRRILDQVVSAFKGIWTQIAPQIAAFGTLLKPLIKAIQNIWEQTKPEWELLGAAVLLIAKIFLSIFGHVIGPILEGAIKIISGALQLIRGIIEVVLAAINGDWSLFFKGLWDMIDGAWRIILGLFEGIVKPILGVVQGLVGGIFGFFKWLWDMLFGHSIVPDIINGFKAAWNSLTYIPLWIYNNILKPIYNFFVTFWNSNLKPIMASIGSAITDPIHALSVLGQWIWDNVLAPIKNNLSNFWDKHLKPVMAQIGSAITDPFHALASLGSWIWDHVLSPIVGFFEDLWTKHLRGPMQGVVNGFYSLGNGIGSAIISGINLGIDAINKLIDGLNWIGSHVPGLKFSVSEISERQYNPSKPPKLETGGMMPYGQVGSGFRTAGARAIVGEGNPLHPEYVIPTDPRHSGNANRLLSRLVGDMERRGTLYGGAGHGAGRTTPAYAGGGILGGLENAASSAWNDVKGVGKYIRKGAVIAAMAPFLKAFDGLERAIPNGMHERDFVNAEKNNIYNWMKGTDSGKIDNPDYVMGPNPNLPQTLPKGDVNKYMDDAASVLKELNQAIQFIPTVMRRMNLESGGNPYAVNTTDINWQQGHPSVGLMQVIAGTFAEYAGRYRSKGPFMYGVSVDPHANIYAGLNYALHRYGNISAIDPSVRPGGYEFGGMLPSLADGAYIKRRVGGTIVRVGEGAHDEAVVPLPNGADGLGGGDTYNFYGDLEFPNIKTAADATGFIENLKSLAGKR